MKKYLFPFCFLIVIFTFSTCKKDDYENKRRNYYEHIDQVDFSCTGILSTLHMSAKLNGKELCYNHNENGYRAYSGIVNGYTTIDPVLNPSSPANNGTWMGFKIGPTTITDLSHAFYIYSPVEASGTPFTEMEEQYLKSSEFLFKNFENNGFSINLVVYCCSEIYGRPQSYTVTSEWGHQTSDNYIRITEVQKRTTPQYIYYDVTFEFQCDLYHHNSNGFQGGEYFGKLEEGVFVTQLAIQMEG